jgi:hypothetical protein
MSPLRVLLNYETREVEIFRMGQVVYQRNMIKLAVLRQ